MEELVFETRVIQDGVLEIVTRGEEEGVGKNWEGMGGGRALEKGRTMKMLTF